MLLRVKKVSVHSSSTSWRTRLEVVVIAVAPPFLEIDRVTEVEAILPRVFFLRDENERARSELAHIAFAHTYPKGNLLYCHGEPCTTLYLMIQGRAKVSLFSDEGREVILTVTRCGEVMGLDSALAMPSCFGTCTTLTESRIAAIPRDRFLSWVREHPNVQQPLLCELSRRLRAAYEMLGAQALLPVKRRLLNALIELARSEGVSNPRGETTFVRPTHQELAELVGSTRVVISRLLKELVEEQQAIEVNGNVIHVYLDDLIPQEQFVG